MRRPHVPGNNAYLTPRCYIQNRRDVATCCGDAVMGVADTGSVFRGVPKFCMHSLACHKIAARGLIKASP